MLLLESRLVPAQVRDEVDVLIDRLPIVGTDLGFTKAGLLALGMLALQIFGVLLGRRRSAERVWAIRLRRRLWRDRRLWRSRGGGIYRGRISARHLYRRRVAMGIGKR